MSDLNSPDVAVRSITTVPPSIESGQCSRLDEILDECISQAKTLSELGTLLRRKVKGLEKEENCQFTPGSLGRHINFVINFLLLDESLLNPNTPKEEKSPYDKEDSARLQHQLTHSILYSTFKSAPAEYIENTYSVVRNSLLRVHSLDTKISTELSSCWRGVRNQVAITRTLLQNGYRVLVPDYTQDPTTIKESVNAVLQLDVLCGVDLVAVSPDNEIILINAKGGGKQGVRITNIRPTNITSTTNPCLKGTLIYLCKKYCGRNYGQIYKAELHIPFEGMAYVPSGILAPGEKTTAEKQQDLRNFGRLRPELSAAIITQVKNIGNLERIISGLQR